MDYTSQFEALTEQLASLNDVSQVVCGLFGLIAGLLIVLIFAVAWRS